MSLGVGKRTLKRRAMNLRLKRNFVSLGLPQTCELKLAGCLKTWALTWSHSRKSRFLTTDEAWLEACLACVSCHDKIESMSHDAMFKHVTDAIAARQPGPVVTDDTD